MGRIVNGAGLILTGTSKMAGETLLGLAGAGTSYTGIGFAGMIAGAITSMAGSALRPYVVPKKNPALVGGEQKNIAKKTAMGADDAAGGVEGNTGAQGVGNPVSVEGRGNTGRIIPNTLNEQMAMNQVKSNPLEGATKVPLEMSDPRWPASEGWVKMQSVIENADGTKTTIHLNYSRLCRESG